MNYFVCIVYTLKDMRICPKCMENNSNIKSIKKKYHIGTSVIKSITFHYFLNTIGICYITI